MVGQLRWDTFRRSNYGYQLDEFTTDQVRWMQTFDALFAAGTSQAPATHLQLERFDSPLLWELLAQAGKIGVALIAAKSGDAVVVHDPVDVSLDLRDHDGGLRLAPHVACGDGGGLSETAAIGAIGTPGHGVFWWDATTGPGTSSAARDLHLAPATAGIPTSVRTLIRHRTELQVPAVARSSFLAESYPQLAQSAHIVCSDGSVDLPEVLPPELVLTAAHTSRELQLGWHWEYRSSITPIRRPLTPSGEGYRDHAFEDRLLAQVAVALAGFPVAWQEQFPDTRFGHPGSPGPAMLTDLAAARFTAEALPRLEQLEHVRVDTTGVAPDYSELTDSPLVAVRTQETDDADWFDLGVTVTLGGDNIPFNQLFLALATGEEYLMLANGNYFRLDQPEFLQLRRLIEEARALQDHDGPLRISRYQAGLWDELEELSANAEQAESWRRSVGGLLGFSEIQDVPQPPGLAASLRPYQQEGFNWLAFLWEHGLGGVLADDMGLGKTLQAIAMILHAKSGLGVPDRDNSARHPFLVVAPTSVVPNWAAEIGRFAPGLRATAVTDTLTRSGTDPAGLTAGSDVVIVSYTLSGWTTRPTPHCRGPGWCWTKRSS